MDRKGRFELDYQKPPASGIEQAAAFGCLDLEMDIAYANEHGMEDVILQNGEQRGESISMEEACDRLAKLEKALDRVVIEETRRTHPNADVRELQEIASARKTDLLEGNRDTSYICPKR